MDIVNSLETYFNILCLVGFILTQVIANLPVKYTEKIPDYVMFVISFLAGNYNQAVNKKTDLNGNSK